MKTFKDIINEVAEPKGGDEKRFKAKHVVAKYNHPIEDDAEENQFKGGTRKDKSKKASYEDGKDAEVYEEADVRTKRADKKAIIIHDVDSEGKSKTFARKQRAGEIKVEGYVSDAQRKAVHASKDEQKKKKKTYKEMFDLDESNTDKYMWKDINAALMKAGVNTSTIMKVVSNLKGKQLKEEVNLEEKVYASDYNVGHEKSQFGGYRPHVTHKKTGKTMYLGQTSYKKPEHAKGHASAYLKGYEAMGDRHANRKANEYEKSNKQHVYKEEVELDEDISKMSHGRLKWHMNTNVPHGSYSKDEMKAERDRRLKYRDSAAAYKKAKASMSEEVELDEAFKMGSMKLKDGSTVKLSKEEAEAVNELFNELNSSNKKRMEEEMMKNKSGFDKVLKFAQEAM